jgi:hypothetical protein
MRTQRPLHKWLKGFAGPRKIQSSLFASTPLYGLAAALATALLILCVWAAPSSAIDYPHNIYGCSACHSDPSEPIGKDELCLTCHDGVTATLAAAHTSTNTSNRYGTWAMACVTCHQPHYQDQRIVYGPASYIASGTSDVEGITETSLRMSGAGWEHNAFAGMVLFPNVTQPSSSYKILGNTADVITVQGPMNLAMTTTGNSSFGVMYGNLISGGIKTPNSGPKPVRFLGPTGTNSYADGNATYDGVCEACHTKTTHHRNNGAGSAQSHYDGTRCTVCHSHASGFVGYDHVGAEVVKPAGECMECHGSAGADPIADVHANKCGLCHVNPLGAGPLFEPWETNAPQGGDCTGCHGELSTAHSNVDHTATFASAPVKLFENNQHEGICHSNNLSPVHGNHCATCHPAPFNTLGAWNGGCQQGGCHETYHQEATKAHQPFDNDNFCFHCHDSRSFGVTQSMCLNCHAANDPSDVTPPVTLCDAESPYVGAARISFTIMDSGKVGVGRTFYMLDSGPVTPAGKNLMVTAPGSHTLEFWSMDQAGNLEEYRKSATFTVLPDITPPTTHSDAKTFYYDSAVITLTASDASSLGVKDTYFSLNGGPTQVGTSVVFTPTAVGRFVYTLEFWSEDWTGNVESRKSVSFEVDVVEPGVTRPPLSLSVPEADLDGTFVVSWGASPTSGVTYVLERSLDDGDFAPVYTSTGLSYTVSGLTNGSYRFRVKATKSGYTESAYVTGGPCGVTLTAVEAPGAISGVPESSITGVFTVSWGASAAPGVNYRLERSLNGGAFTQIYSGTATSYAVNGLGDGSYVFRVKASLTGYVDSDYVTSGACTVTLIIEPPASITVPATDYDGAFTVTWQASPTSSVSYVLEWSENGGLFTEVYRGTLLSRAFSGLTDGSYAFRVKAIRTGYADSAYQNGTCEVTLTSAAMPGSLSGLSESSTTGAFTVSWGASATGGVTYKLERSLNGGSFTQIYSGTSTSYTVSGLTDGSYVFRVKATLTGHVDSAYQTSGTCVVTLTVAAPSSITVPETDLDGSFTVNWGASATSSVTYVLERADNGGPFVQVYSGTLRSFTVSGLAEGSYEFRVKAIRTGYVDSAYQSGTCMVTVTTVGTPGSLAGVPESNTTGTFTVSWGASATGGVTYKLERSLNGGAFTQIYSGTSTSYTVSSLADGSYVFRVKATITGYVDSAYQTSGTCVVTLTVAAPSSITVPETDLDGAFTVNWGTSPTFGVTYVLERSDNEGPFVQVYSGTLRSFAVSGLMDGSYEFRVKAIRTGYADSSYQSGTCVVAVTAVQPPASIAVPAADYDGAFTVTWEASPTSSVTYVLERSYNGGSFVQVYSGTLRSFAVSGLADGSYEFQVKAIRTGYVDSTYQSGTCVVTATVAAMPGSLSGVPESSTTGSFTVSWGASATGGVTYKLERSLNGGSFTQVYSGTSTSYTVSGLTNGSYAFRVKATLTGYVDSAYQTSGACVVTLTVAEPSSVTVPETDLDGAFTVSWGASATISVTYVLERSDNGGPFVQIYSGTLRSFAVSGLADGSYAFRVKAIRTGYADSAYQNGTCVVTLTAVGTPGILSGVPESSTTGSFTVSWGASATGGVTYKLERSLNGGSFTQVFSGASTSYTVSGLTDGSYVFRVKATLTGYVDSAYQTSGTCVVTLTVAAPSSITVPATDLDGAFTVSWGTSATTGVTYVLEQSDNGGEFVQAYSGTLRSLAISGLADGSYEFRVKAIRTGYADSTFQSGTCTVTLTTVGVPASITVPPSDSDGSFTVSWGASATSSVFYKLERSDSGGPFAQIYSGTSRGYAVSGLTDGSYVFRVKATRAGYVDSAYVTAEPCVVDSTP